MSKKQVLTPSQNQNKPNFGGDTLPSRIPAHPQSDPLAEFQPIPIADARGERGASPPRNAAPPKGARVTISPRVLLFGAAALLGILVYLIYPARINLLVLGVDDRAPNGVLGRTDTMLLFSILPSDPYIGGLSIPRDLWVNIPGVGENRINTAHFFAEAAQPGSGAQAAMQTVTANFGVPCQYFVRLNFNDVVGVVDALGGLKITLPEALGGYPAGEHRLNGVQALAFARDRAGSDDFARMRHAQILFGALLQAVFTPQNLPNLPQAAPVIANAIETNLPWWLLPRLVFTVWRAYPQHVTLRTLDRDFVTPFVTDGGAQVLLPRWEVIQPLVAEMFGVQLPGELP
ncbi:MAG: LCP family protein [Anaerolineales bacterium]